MNFNQELLKKNKNAEICSVYMAADDIRKNLQDNKNHCRSIALKIFEYKPERLLFIGSGASYCTLYTPWYFMNTTSDIPSILMRGPELIAAGTEFVKGKRTYAILSSYSGKTADTVEAAGYLKNLGVPLVALSKSDQNPLVKICEDVISYNSKCLYTSAMANMLMVMAELQILYGEKQLANHLMTALEKLPDQMTGIIKKSEQIALETLELLKDDEFIYVLGDGPLWGLTYQYGYTNLMEYSRIHAACLPAAEWRHGPLEIMFRNPAMIILMGNDCGRKYVEATASYCKKRGARVAIFDVKDYLDTHPVLAPFVLHAVAQLFILYYTTYKNIDLDEYLEMHIHPYVEDENYF